MSDQPLLSYAELERFLTDAEKAELVKLLSQDTRLFYPTPGPQMAAATVVADIIGYGGAAGGGKTMLISGLALTEHHRTAIFRQHKNQTQKFVQDFKKILGTSAGYSSQVSAWQLPLDPADPSKGTRLIEFGGLEDPQDHEKWQGRDHDLKAFDEATQMREADVRYVMGWARSDNPAQKVRVLLTFNPPTTVEGRWVIRFFAPWLDPLYPGRKAKDGELRWFTTIDGNQDFEVPDGRPFVRDEAGDFVYEFDPKAHAPEEIYQPMSRTFITAKVSDNPYYMATGYVKTLQNMPEPLRSQMLLGDFMAGVEDDARQVIPTAWVEEAQARWLERRNHPEFRKGPLDSLGVDAARGGNMGGTAGYVGRDKMTIAPRHGTFFDEVVAIPGVDVNTGGKAAAEILSRRTHDAPVHLDVAGIGTSVLDALNENKIYVVAINNTSKSFGLTRGGTLRFANKRAELIWRMREALDPTNPDPIALPPDPELLADLTAARWWLDTTGIKVEPKLDIKERIGRSPDKGEAVIYANITSPKRELVAQSRYDVPAHLRRDDYDTMRLRELER